MGNKNNKENKKAVERDYEFIQVNAATGQQYRKVETLRSEDGSITPEMVRNFHDESAKEARQWRRNNPGKSISFRTIMDENGGKVIELNAKNELIFPAGYRVKLYDENGNEIVGAANVQKEINRREQQWEQWEMNGELEEELQNHQTDDGFASIRFRVAPVKLHSNESGVPEEFFDNKKRKAEESITSGGETKRNDNQKGHTDSRLPNSNEIKNASEEQLIGLINQINEELESRKKGGREILWASVSDQELESKLQELGNSLNKFEKVSNTSFSPDNLDKVSKIPVGGIIALVSLFSVFAFGGLILAKRKFGGKGRKR